MTPGGAPHEGAQTPELGGQDSERIRKTTNGRTRKQTREKVHQRVVLFYPQHHWIPRAPENFVFFFSKGCLRNRVRNENNSSGMEEKCQKTEEWLVVADEAFISV